MGRATIVEHLGRALYTIDVHRDSGRTTALEQVYRDEAASISATLPALETEANAVKNDLTAARLAYENDPSLFNEWLQAAARYYGPQQKYLAMKMRVQYLIAKADALQGYTGKRRTTAWCSTYTTNLAPGTEVATKEISYQPHHRILERGIIISPLGAAPVADDGQIRHIMSMTPAQTFLNYALLPGAATWRKRYSSGTVSEVDEIGQKLLVALHLNTAAGYFIWPKPENYQWLSYDTNECIDAIQTSKYRESDRVLVEHNQNYKPEKVIGWSEYPRQAAACTNIFFDLRSDDWGLYGDWGYMDRGPKSYWLDTVPDFFNRIVSAKINDVACEVQNRSSVDRIYYYLSGNFPSMDLKVEVILEDGQEKQCHLRYSASISMSGPKECQGYAIRPDGGLGFVDHEAVEDNYDVVRVFARYSKKVTNRSFSFRDANIEVSGSQTYIRDNNDTDIGSQDSVFDSGTLLWLGHIPDFMNNNGIIRDLLIVNHDFVQTTIITAFDGHQWYPGEYDQEFVGTASIQYIVPVDISQFPFLT